MLFNVYLFSATYFDRYWFHWFEYYFPTCMTIIKSVYFYHSFTNADRSQAKNISWSSSSMSLGKVGPCWSHHWYAFFSHWEMMRFLIIFNITGFENCCSTIGVISEFAHCCSFKIGWIEAKLIMSSYLIQCILIAHVLICCEV